MKTDDEIADEILNDWGIPINDESRLEMKKTLGYQLNLLNTRFKEVGHAIVKELNVLKRRWLKCIRCL